MKCKKITELSTGLSRVCQKMNEAFSQSRPSLSSIRLLKAELAGKLPEAKKMVEQWEWEANWGKTNLFEQGNVETLNQIENTYYVTDAEGRTFSKEEMDGQTHSLTPDHLLEKNVLNLKVFATEGMVTFYLIMKRGIQVKYINSLRGQFQNVSFKGIPDILATDINGKEMFIFDSLSKSISILTGEGRLSPEISKLPNSALDDKEVACLKVQENQVFLGTINGDIFRYDLESEEMQAVVQGEAEDINESQSQLLVSDEFLVHKINSNILIYKKDGTLIKSLPCSPATKTISITDENRLICPDGDKIQIFELSTGDHFAELPMAIEADDKIESVVLSKDSNSLFIGLSSGKIINLSKSKEHLPRNYKSA